MFILISTVRHRWQFCKWRPINEYDDDDDDDKWPVVKGLMYFRWLLLESSIPIHDLR